MELVGALPPSRASLFGEALLVAFVAAFCRRVLGDYDLHNSAGMYHFNLL